jgi:hypothetical protein
MKTLKPLVIGAAAWLLASSTAFAEVHVTMQNGRVTVVAKDATLRQILTEWARVGQTKIINVERIPGGPLSLEFQNLPEGQALDVLLRSVAGYLAAPRAVAVANLSVFDRIVVMPAAAGPRVPVAASVGAPTFPQPQFNQPTAPDDEPEEPRPAPGVAVPNQNRSPVFNTFPQQQPPQIVNPQMPGGVQTTQPVQQAPSAFPTAPAGGVSVPGMVAPPPPQQPGQVAQPVRRPSGPGGQ